MNDFQTVTSIPSTFNMINPVKSKNITEDKTCLASFDYFNNGSQGSVYWGSEKPMDEVFPSNFKPHSGKPTHSIWNNSTKRKTIVNIKK
uniref:Uncharacterized protein n=1 Tax=viral metagenome TaxID=1070528 RepID=A0A6C0CGE4_9ZZZZ